MDDVTAISCDIQNLRKIVGQKSSHVIGDLREPVTVVDLDISRTLEWQRVMNSTNVLGVHLATTAIGLYGCAVISRQFWTELESTFGVLVGNLSINCSKKLDALRYILKWSRLESHDSSSEMLAVLYSTYRSALLPLMDSVTSITQSDVLFSFLVLVRELSHWVGLFADVETEDQEDEGPSWIVEREKWDKGCVELLHHCFLKQLHFSSACQLEGLKLAEKLCTQSGSEGITFAQSCIPLSNWLRFYSLQSSESDDSSNTLDAQVCSCVQRRAIRLSCVIMRVLVEHAYPKTGSPVQSGDVKGRTILTPKSRRRNKQTAQFPSTSEGLSELPSAALDEEMSIIEHESESSMEMGGRSDSNKELVEVIDAALMLFSDVLFDGEDLSNQLAELCGEEDDVLIQVLNDLLRCYICCKNASGVSETVQRVLADPLNPHFLFNSLQLLLSFDASTNMDFLISNETMFLEYLLRYLKVVAAEWEQIPHLAIPIEGVRDDDEREYPDISPYYVNLRYLLIALSAQLEKLQAKKLMPYNAAPLIAAVQAALVKLLQLR